MLIVWCVTQVGFSEAQMCNQELITKKYIMEPHILEIVNNRLNTNIYSYLETSGGQSYNIYLNVVYFFNTSLYYTSVAAEDSCFPELVSNMHCYIVGNKTCITSILVIYIKL